ncbi:adenosylcobinamide-GDP ribazoletransferase [Lichenicola sp.]|uniref:adenosylcobinamide-GDP ribazoletransferase n=1 Tax=Lichenicola sp. TaxID=2804529 RepID=UPI003AFFF0FC
MTIRADLAAGFGLLTRVPVGWLVPAGEPYRPGRAVWTYPLAGLLAGAVTAAVVALAHMAGLTALLGAVWAISAAVLLTGGLHEDGLADTADGFGGGRTPERRLEIMRDSRIGSYGALALVLSLALRITAVAALPPAHATAILLATGALSRAAMLPVLGLLPPARADGLGHGVGSLPRAAIATGAGIAGLAALVALPLPRALAAIVVAAAAGLLMAALARRRIGGQTGDVCGASCAVAECAVLTLLAAG